MHEETPELAILLDDGATKPFFIPAETGIYPALQGERRLMLDEEVQAYNRKLAQYERTKNGPAADRLRYQLVADKVTSWTAARLGEDGQPVGVEVSVENVKRLPPAFCGSWRA